MNRIRELREGQEEDIGMEKSREHFMGLLEGRWERGREESKIDETTKQIRQERKEEEEITRKEIMKQLKKLMKDKETNEIVNEA